jgi:hypothetical protein
VKPDRATSEDFAFFLYLLLTAGQSAEGEKRLVFPAISRLPGERSRHRSPARSSRWDSVIASLRSLPLLLKPRPWTLLASLASATVLSWVCFHILPCGRMPLLNSRSGT